MLRSFLVVSSPFYQMEKSGVGPSFLSSCIARNTDKRGPHFAKGRHPHEIILGYSHLSPAQIEQGSAHIKRALDEKLFASNKGGAAPSPLRLAVHRKRGAGAAQCSPFFLYNALTAVHCGKRAAGRRTSGRSL
jgi:hypothetical protein